jgi:hypothetical protein
MAVGRPPALLLVVLAIATTLASFGAALTPTQVEAARRQHSHRQTERDRNAGAKHDRQATIKGDRKSAGKDSRKSRNKKDGRKSGKKGAKKSKAKRDGQASSEVVRGTPVVDGTYPFVAALVSISKSGNPRRQFCGGSLIAPSYVLTAAHCVSGAKPQRFGVVVGQTEFGSSQGEFRKVAGYNVHPSYQAKTISNDLAVITLSEPILSIAPIPLVNAGDISFDGHGTALTLVGWGDMARAPHPEQKGKFPNRMQHRQITVIDESTCKKQWHRVGFQRAVTTEATLCTTARRFGSGDSGSPLFATVGGSYVQVSLVSGGFAGKKKRTVSDFGPRLSTPALSDFIHSVTG